MNAKVIILSCFAVCSQCAFTQVVKLQIIDAQTKEAIPHVAVFTKDNKEGTYADENGKVQFEFSAANDTLFFSAIGYELLRISLKKALGNDRIALNSAVLSLPDVTISSKAIKIEQINLGFFRRIRPLPTYTIRTNINNRFALLINNPKREAGWVDKLRIRFDVTPNKVADTYRIQLRVYKNENGRPGNDLLVLPFVDIKPTQQSLEYEISEKKLPFPVEGVFIGYDALGYKDQTGVYHTFKRGQKVPHTKKGEWVDFLVPGIAIDKKHKVVIFEANGLGSWSKSFMTQSGAPMFGLVASFRTP